MANSTPAGNLERLNRIMYAIQLRPMTIVALGVELDLGRRCLLGALRKLMDAGKICYVESPSDRRNKVYQITAGAMPYDIAKTVKSLPPPKKRGPKLGSNRPTYDQAEARKVKTVPAQQVGIKRDPLVAMLFGAPA